MASLKERFEKWKSERNLLQKFGDMAFWALIILMLIPGPRKHIATAANRLFLVVKNPREKSAEKQVLLSDADYRWVLHDGQGGSLQLEELRGEVLFVNFWATWCPPCIAEMPEIQAAYDRWGDQVRFLLISNQDPEEVGGFLEQRGYELPVHYARSPLPPALEHNALPTTMIISRDGRVVSHKTGAANWNSRATDRIFESLLAE